MMHVFGLLAGARAAHAEPILVIASVEADLRTIHGEIRGAPAGAERGGFASPLEWLDAPTSDVDRIRTGPGPLDRGSMSIQPGEAGATFTTILPRRYGDTGALRGEGLWSNGTWLPMVPAASGEEIHTWSVSISLPPNVVGVLNGEVHPGEPGGSTWSLQLRADRLALAVLPAARAPVTTADLAGGSVTFVGRAAQRPNVRKQIRALVEQGWPWADTPPHLVVVTDHDRRRLATAGPGVVYLSDRAFRLSPGLSRFHWPAVRRALFAAGLDRFPAWDAAFMATAAAEGMPAPSVERSLGWAAWNPIIDDLLTDGTLPFYADTFNLSHPEEPDALLAASGRRDPRAAALQAGDSLAPGHLPAVVRAAARGGGPDPLGEACAGALDPRVLDAWNAPEPADSAYAVHRAPREGLVVSRGAGAAIEPVVLVENGQRTLWIAPPAPSSQPLAAEVRAADVDPDAHLRDADREDNRAPPKWSTVVTGWVTQYSPSQGTFDAWADVILRRQGDTRNLLLVGGSHDAEDLASVYAGYLRYLGPLVNRRVRQHRIYATFGPSILDPSFRSTESGDLVLGGAVGYAWDTRADDTWAYEGRRVSLGVGLGGRVGADDRWASAGAGWTELIPFHPRHVFAVRLKAGWASGDVEHRLLPLGGADAVRALPENGTLANERALVNAEYRWAVLRDLSVPGPLLWLSEIDIAPGLEAGAAWRDGESAPRAAAGADFGVYGIFDVLGARPTLYGAVVAVPIEPAGSPVPQVYLSFDRSF